MGWLLIFLIFWLSLLMFFTVYYKELKTYLGGSVLKKELDKLPKDKYLVIEDIILEDSNKEKYKIDAVILSRYGIFVVKLKNVSGMIKANSNDNAWEVTKNKKMKYITNGIKENEKNIKVLSELLNMNNIFVSIVGFSNNTKIYSDSNFITQINYIDNLIMLYNREVLNVNLFDLKNIIVNADIKSELKRDLEEEKVEEIKTDKNDTN